jgi:hypothetical protein
MFGQFAPETTGNEETIDEIPPSRVIATRIVEQKQCAGLLPTNLLDSLSSLVFVQRVQIAGCQCLSKDCFTCPLCTSRPTPPSSHQSHANTSGSHFHLRLAVSLIRRGMTRERSCTTHAQARKVEIIGDDSRGRTHMDPCADCIAGPIGELVLALAAACGVWYVIKPAARAAAWPAVVKRTPVCLLRRVGLEVRCSTVRKCRLTRPQPACILPLHAFLNGVRIGNTA